MEAFIRQHENKRHDEFNQCIKFGNFAKLKRLLIAADQQTLDEQIIQLTREHRYVELQQLMSEVDLDGLNPNIVTTFFLHHLDKKIDLHNVVDQINTEIFNKRYALQDSKDDLIVVLAQNFAKGCLHPLLPIARTWGGIRNNQDINIREYTSAFGTFLAGFLNCQNLKTNLVYYFSGAVPSDLEFYGALLGRQKESLQRLTRERYSQYALILLFEDVELFRKLKNPMREHYTDSSHLPSYFRICPHTDIEIHCRLLEENIDCNTELSKYLIFIKENVFKITRKEIDDNISYGIPSYDINLTNLILQYVPFQYSENDEFYMNRFFHSLPFQVNNTIRLGSSFSALNPVQPHGIFDNQRPNVQPWNAGVAGTFDIVDQITYHDSSMPVFTPLGAPIGEEEKKVPDQIPTFRTLLGNININDSYLDPYRDFSVPTFTHLPVSDRIVHEDEGELF